MVALREYKRSACADPGILLLNITPLLYSFFR
jgi:hypothetical protein